MMAALLLCMNKSFDCQPNQPTIFAVASLSTSTTSWSLLLWQPPAAAAAGACCPLPSPSFHGSNVTRGKKKKKHQSTEIMSEFIKDFIFMIYSTERKRNVQDSFSCCFVGHSLRFFSGVFLPLWPPFAELYNLCCGVVLFDEALALF